MQIGMLTDIHKMWYKSRNLTVQNLNQAKHMLHMVEDKKIWNKNDC